MGLFDGRKARKHYEAGLAALGRSDYAVAIRELQSATAYRPRNATMQHDYGVALMAAADFRRTGRDEATHAEHVYELATEALRALTAALRLQPQFPEAHNDRGRALVKLDRLPEAEDAFQTALGQRASYRQAAENLGWLRSQMAILETSTEEGADNEVMQTVRTRALQQD